jgi:hypothetical protein
MRIAAIVGALFLAAALGNATKKNPRYDEACAGFCIGAVLLGLAYAMRTQSEQERAFDEWLLGNVENVYKSSAEYDGVLISAETKLVQYETALSFLIVSFKVPTRHYIVGERSAVAASVICSVTSLVFGWWGLPWGPIYTVGVLSSNSLGGKRQTIAERLGQLIEEQRAAERRNNEARRNDVSDW